MENINDKITKTPRYGLNNVTTNAHIAIDVYHHPVREVAHNFDIINNMNAIMGTSRK
jgi:hypothetical protein